MSVHFSEVEHRHLLDFFVNAPAIIVLTRGPEHVIELVNPRFLAMAGRSNLAEVIGQPASEAFPDLAAVGYVDLADQVYTSGVPFVSAELPSRRDRDGDGVIDSIWTNVVIQPLRNARGEVEGLFLHGFDVTDQVVARQQAEELSAKLAAERGFLEAVLRRMPAGVAIVEAPTGQVLLANDQIEQIWGKMRLGARSDSRDPQVAGPLANGLSGDIPNKPLVEAIGRGEVVIGQETTLRRVDGAPTTIQMSAAPIRGPGWEDRRRGHQLCRRYRPQTSRASPSLTCRGERDFGRVPRRTGFSGSVSSRRRAGACRLVSGPCCRGGRPATLPRRGARWPSGSHAR